MGKRDRSKLSVLQKRCDQCLFSDAKIVDDKRREQVLADCKESGRYFTCHKASMKGRNDVCCRGFFDTQDSLLLRLAKVLKLFRWVKESELG